MLYTEHMIRYDTIEEFNFIQTFGIAYNRTE